MYCADWVKILLLAIIRLIKRALMKLAQRRIVSILILFLTFAIVNGTLFHYFEVINGPQKNLTYFQSIYWAIVTMATVGYGDIVPQTFAGYIIASLTIVLGIAVFTLLVSTIAEAFLRQSLRRYMGLVKLKHVDVVVVGASEICREAIDELRNSGRGYRIAWVLEERPRAPPEDIDFVVGDPLDEDTLIRAGIKSAKHLIICILDDSATIHIALMAKRLNKNLKIAAIAKSNKTKELLEEAGVSIVVPLRIIGRELASAVFEPSVTLFVDEVTSSRGIADLIEVPIDHNLSGMTPEEVVKGLEHRDRAHRYVPLMLVKDSGDRIAAPDSGTKLKSGDKLVVLKAKRNTE